VKRPKVKRKKKEKRKNEGAPTRGRRESRNSHNWHEDKAVISIFCQRTGQEGERRNKLKSGIRFRREMGGTQKRDVEVRRNNKKPTKV